MAWIFFFLSCLNKYSLVLKIEQWVHTQQDDLFVISMLITKDISIVSAKLYTEFKFGFHRT